MIDKYVEKDIYRQIMISKLLFKNGTLNVNDLVNHFKISRNTVVAYVSQIDELISIDAATINYEKGKITLVGKENVVLFELCQRIYGCSKWLKFVCSYLEGNTIENISNNSYLSLASSYRYKNQLDEYLNAIEKENALSHHINDENMYRMLKTYIFFLTGEELSFVDASIYNRYSTNIYKFIENTCEGLQRKYFSESWEYIELAIFIAIDEITNKYPLKMPQRLKEDLNQFAILKVVKKSLIDSGLDTIINSEDEIVAITLLFIQLPYITTNMDVFEKEFDRVNNYYLKNIPEYKELITRFCSEFGENNTKSLIFYKAIVSYIDSMAIDYQEFLPEQEEILEEKDLNLKDRVSSIIKWWTQEYLKEDYHIRDKCIDKLTNRISFILNHRVQYMVRIVGSSDFEYQAIKKCIVRLECRCEFVLAPETYYELSKAIDIKTKENELIICTSEKFYCNEKKTIKVNLKTLQIDIIKGLLKYELI